ncbi:MAG: hypothetical protein COA91_08095 [Robiginitomaculum sp.]|nr:MAG: hypothetical protein COA91_08095 [Robiginitomaculum sp.]
MILTCPECATRFQIADDAVGSNGRTVRCSQCSTTWFVAAEPDALALNEAEKYEVQKQEDLREEIIRKPVSDMSGEIPALDADSHHEDGLLPSFEPDETLQVGAHATIRDQAERKKVRRRLLDVGMIWIVTLVILALFALAAYLFRAKIVAQFPGAAPVYRAIGLEANSSGLEIYGLETREGNTDGVEVLIVTGKIKNFDTKPRNVEMIRLNFKNTAGEVLASWVVEPPKSVLKPGETISFISQYPNRPVGATKLAPEFINETANVTNVPLVPLASQ